MFIGGLFCDMLGDAPKWKLHRFVPAGSGKSTLLEFARALLGRAVVGAVARQLIRRRGLSARGSRHGN
jgi:ribose 1,5-bisphosphokinase PhnN